MISAINMTRQAEHSTSLASPGFYWDLTEVSRTVALLAAHLCCCAFPAPREVFFVFFFQGISGLCAELVWISGMGTEQEGGMRSWEGDVERGVSEQSFPSGWEWIFFFWRWFGVERFQIC